MKLLRLFAGLCFSAYCLSLAPSPARAASSALLGWNNLGMHCMDSDYSVFSILPPYNTIEAQLIVNGRLVTSGAGYTVTYQAVADPAGSFNSTSAGKGNFYSFVAPLYGAALSPNQGLAGWGMPGPNNTPQNLLFENTNLSALVNWFRAEGIPLTPYDDAGHKNPYPMMRLVATDSLGNVLGASAIVLPVSDEMDCRACHASGSQAAAQPAAGWVNDPNPERDYRLNILRLHDEHQFSLHAGLYASALAARGLNAAGLYSNVTADNKPILCASCHASAALDTTSFGTVPQLTTSVHSWHAHAIDPLSGTTLDNTDNRSACYRCHPGSTTRCLRGAMGAAVAADGSMAMQCQSCHGTMSQVGSSSRLGWLMEPACGSCHTGTATSNNGQIRYTSVFEVGGIVRSPVDRTFATSPDAPATGLSLYRFSKGHGDLQCEACHGSTHAEFPTTHLNDNLRNVQLQGHVGVMVECTACHVTTPNTITGGPHGLHPVGQTWVNQHGGLFESGISAAQCQPCHGQDYRGTVLSRAQADRSLVAGSDNGTATLQLFRGATIGCYTCHNGPQGESINNNPPPTVSNVSATTSAGQPVTMTLPATGANLSLRIVSQPAHGTVGLQGTTATYYPESGFLGTDSFTFATYDGAKNSGLGTATVTVGTVVDNVAPTVKITSPTSSPTYAAGGASLTLGGTSSDNVGVVSVTWANNRGGSGTATGTTSWSIQDLPLQTGVNVITVTALDAANHSGSDTLTVTWAGGTLITLVVNGQGTVSPNPKGAAWKLGRNYTLTAKPAAGYVFAGWTGSLASGTPSLSFLLQSNVVLQANFIPSPFTAVSGTYNGLFSEPNSVSHLNAGSFTFAATSGGGLSGKLQLAGAKYTVSGQFDLTGQARVSIPRPAMAPLTVALQLDLTNGTDHVTGSVSDGTWTAGLAGDRAVFDGKTNVAPQAGQYTLVFPGNYDSTTEPGGDGYGTLTVDKAGRIQLAASLADGTKFSQSVSLSKSEQWPLYAPLYNGQGMVSSWLTFSNSAAGDLGGNVTWVMGANPKAKSYPGGFAVDMAATGSRYTPPSSGGKVLNLTNAYLSLNGANLPQSLTNSIALGPNSRVANLGTGRLSLSFVPATGMFSGSIANPQTGRPIPFNGVVLQKQNTASGYFLGGTQSGQVWIGTR